MINKRCWFKNKWMQEPCNRKLMYDHGDLYCYIHGTMTHIKRAWDIPAQPGEDAKNAREKWSKEDLANLVALVNDGISIDEIAEILGRTKNSIYNKAWAIKNNERKTAKDRTNGEENS